MDEERIEDNSESMDSDVDTIEATDDILEIEEVKKKQPPKKLKLKKTWRNKFITPTGIEISEGYCRRCVQYKNPKEFHKSPDDFLDKNGLMSICKTCCEEIYQNYLKSERDIYSAMLKTCRKLNWFYHPASVDSSLVKLKKAIDSNSAYNITPTYWAIVNTSKNLLHGNSSISEDLTFKEPLNEDFVPKEMVDESVSEDVIKFWGDGFDILDYQYLESEFQNFKKTHQIITYSEQVLCREVCYELLKMKKTRMNGQDVDAKRLESLMKSLAISPSMTTASNSSKSMDTFSAFIKTIEETEPAEYFEDKKIFKDVDNIEGYFKKFVVRPMKNFVTGSRDFNIHGEDENSDFDLEPDEETLKEEENPLHFIPKEDQDV